MTTFIAEIGSNHNGDFGRACALIDVAAACGFNGVKLQLYRPERLFCPEALAREPGLASKPVLKVDWLDPLIDRAHANGLTIGVTPFDVGAVDVLASRQIDFVKVASYSLIHGKLLDAVAGLKKRVYVSTGMATDLEISDAYSRLNRLTYGITLMHCTSSYPTEPRDADLGRMRRLMNLSAYVGYSDHTRNADVVMLAAVHYEADAIELHFDLDGDGAEFDGGHCWLPSESMDAISRVGVAMQAAASHAIRPDKAEREWRADPSDGLRPMRSLRDAWAAEALLRDKNE